MDESLKNSDDYEESLEIGQFTQGIEFKDVSFSYDEAQVFRSINLFLKKGGKYLVVGPSGGGIPLGVT